jgi:hypothetical protein
MGEPERAVRAAAADLAAAIERLAADLALAEEPARFVAALEGEGEATPSDAAPDGRDRVTDRQRIGPAPRTPP